MNGKTTAGPYQKEFAKYTPLMLACASPVRNEKNPDANLETVKNLLKIGCKFTMTDELGNTLLQIAALAGNNKTIDYLAKSLPGLDIFARNARGETALSICAQLKNKEGEATLGSLQKDYDKSGDAAQALFADLMADETKEDAEKAKKAAKRQRNKVNRIAKAEKKTTEEVAEERRLAAELKAKEDEASARKEAELEAEAERHEKLERSRRQEENRKLREELERVERQEALEKARLEAEERRRQRQLLVERDAERQRIVTEKAEKRARYEFEVGEMKRRAMRS